MRRLSFDQSSLKTVRDALEALDCKVGAVLASGVAMVDEKVGSGHVLVGILKYRHGALVSLHLHEQVAARLLAMEAVRGIVGEEKF